MKVERVTTICEEIQCTGCAACFNACRHSAIEMHPDNEGFLRPSIINDRCVGCGLCVRCCPVNKSVDFNEAPLSIYCGWSRNEEIRMSSASGGAFSELAIFFIEQLHGVVFGVAMTERLEACHISIENKNDLIKLQGSKYIQSNINDTYRQVENYLEDGRKVLFSGTPCQIAGLKNYLRKEYTGLYTVDLICHGVPSKRLFDDYIKWLERRLHRRIYDIKFRCKKSSWIFFNMAANSHVEKGSRHIRYDYEGGYYSDPFIRGFLRDNALRPSCYFCQYTSIKRTSDFTVADWWGYQAENLEDKDFDKKGVSLIFANSSKAIEIIPHLNMLLKNRTLVDALNTNKSLIEPFDMPNTRKAFWEDYSKCGFDFMVEKWMAPEKMRPSQYVKYKLNSSYFRKVLVAICRVYEKICGVLKCDVIKIKA